MRRPPTPSPQARGLYDNLVVQARRRGVPVSDELPLFTVLERIDPEPLIPHRAVMAAGAVLARIFRHDREISDPRGPERPRSSTDRSF